QNRRRVLIDGALETAHIHRTRITPFTLFWTSTMQLGFVSAILPELSLKDVAEYARDTGYTCVELMCWPPSKAERRYAGVTHVDVSEFGPKQVGEVRSIMEGVGVEISGLGYYPNPLVPDRDEAGRYVAHLRKLIEASA